MTVAPWTLAACAAATGLAIWLHMRAASRQSSQPHQTWGAKQSSGVVRRAARATPLPQTDRVERPVRLPLRPDLSPTDHLTVDLSSTNIPRVLAIYSDLVGRQLLPRTNSALERLDELLHGQLTRWRLVKLPSKPDSGVRYHRDGYLTASEVKETLEALFNTNSIALVPVGRKYFRVQEMRRTVTTN